MPIPLPDPDILSVLICTHNRPRALAHCLRSLPRERWLQTVVIDSGSCPRAARMVARLATKHGALLVREERPGLSRARNRGLDAALGRWAAFLDDDVRVAPGWAAAMREGLAALPDSAGAAGGPIHPLPGMRLPGWWPREMRACLSLLDGDEPAEAEDGLLPPGIAPYGANIAFRADVLRALGGFPERLGRDGRNLASAEETFILRRLSDAGHGIHFLRDAMVRHAIEPERLTPAWLLKRQFWSGRSEACMLTLLAEHDRARAKAWRLAMRAALLAPLGIWPARGARLIRMRCRLAFARGFVGGFLMAARSGP